MRRMFRALLALLLLAVASGPAYGALISRDWLAPGDGLLTLDTKTNLEWLDVSQTALALFPGVRLEDRYQSIVAQTQTGGQFAGFAPAIPAQALQLAVNAGITLGTNDFATNSAGASLLVDLIGFTQPGNNGNLYLLGLINEIRLDVFGRPQRSMLVVSYQPGRTPTPDAAAFDVSAFFLFQRYPPGDGDMAVLLVRDVPEPSTALLFSLAFEWLATRSRRRFPSVLNTLIL